MNSPVGRRWVVNASPIILLARIDQASLLDQLASEIMIPSEVAREIQDGPIDDPGRSWLNGAGASRVRDPGPVSPIVAAWDLGAGESQVLSWAYAHPEFEAIVDDRAARTCAAALAIRARGTLGVVLLAKEEGKLALAIPILEQIRAAGLRISDAVFDAARQLSGES
jgi:predicted nucleic acid-binding protein